jgi:hypothetical protein
VRELTGAGFAFGLSAAFQWFEDTSPYLTLEQRAFRTGISGIGGAVAWAAGGFATYSLGASALAGPIGIVVGGVVTYAWIKWIQPVIFDYAGLNPKRDLAVFQQ